MAYNIFFTIYLYILFAHVILLYRVKNKEYRVKNKVERRKWED